MARSFGILIASVKSCLHIDATQLMMRLPLDRIICESKIFYAVTVSLTEPGAEKFC